MKTGPVECAQKILTINFVLAITVYFLQPDIFANFKNSLDPEYKVKKSLKTMTQDVRDYIFSSKTKKFPEDPRILNLDTGAAGLDQIPDNWNDFNDKSGFIFKRRAGEKFTDSNLKIVFIQKKSGPIGKWASFEDGSLRIIKDRIQVRESVQ